MKFFFVKTITVCILLVLSLSSFAQGLPEQYREEFPLSFPIRLEQRLEIKDYIDILTRENAEKSNAMFLPDFSSVEAYSSSLPPYRDMLGDYFGYPPSKAKSGHISKFLKVGEDQYSDIYRVWIEVMEGVHAYGLYLLPKNLKGKAPMLVAIHGGGGNPEAIVGLDTRVNYHMFGHEAVKRGYIVWAPALIMYSNYSGDTIVPGAERATMDAQLKFLGQSMIGVEIHKIIESTKTLMEEREEIDSERVGMTGLSWGGFYTIYTTALCPFIKAAAPSGYQRDSESDLMTLSKDYRGMANYQAIGLICPRPCMVQMGIEDGVFDFEGAKKEALKAAEIYEKLEVGQNFIFQDHPGGHEYNNEQLFAFFKEYL